MEVPESIEVVSSEDGNVPATPVADTPPTPSEPVVDTPNVDPVPPVEELYELPDGRKVDAATLQHEWKNNFSPEFTRRSQELAELKKGPQPEPPKSPFADPEYVPQSYEEIIQAAKHAALTELAQQEQTRVAQQQAVENAVVEQLSGLAKTVQKTTAENIAKRNDPVSVAPGGSTGTRPDPSAFGSAIEYMRSLK